ncbi:MAG: hypothetical protein J6S68_07040 [Acinetobacter sp.]|nr:hypothetical protein [Acinetobacter sp.]
MNDGPLKVAYVQYPNLTAILYCNEGIIRVFRFKEVKAHHIRKEGFTIYDHFAFNNGLCVPHVRPRGDALELSSVAAFSLMLKLARLEEKDIQIPRDFKWIFEGADLNNVMQWHQNVLTPLSNETPMNELPAGQTQRISVREERKRNSGYWQHLIDKKKQSLQL